MSGDHARLDGSAAIEARREERESIGQSLREKGRKTNERRDNAVPETELGLKNGSLVSDCRHRYFDGRFVRSSGDSHRTDF